MSGMVLDQQVIERRVNWLASIRKWQGEFLGALTPREFVDCITDDLLGQGVFVFTPCGEVMRLPRVCVHLFPPFSSGCLFAECLPPSAQAKLKPPVLCIVVLLPYFADNCTALNHMMMHHDVTRS